MSLCRVILRRSMSVSAAALSKGDIGSGVGHGGGAGGSIREAGGKFGELEAAVEEAYFRKVEAEQLKQLRKLHDDDIKAHEREIARHRDAIRKHKENREKLTKLLDKQKEDD